MRENIQAENMKRLAIITTHPIQYNAPWFKLLADRKKIYPKVFYTWGQSESGIKFDPGFGKKIEWDIPLLEGYEYTFVNNIAGKPGSHHFNGIDNPTLIDELSQWKPHAILVIGWAFKSHLKCIRYFHKKIPVFFRGDSTILNENGIIKKIARRIFLRWVYHYIDYALYVGSNNKKYFQANGLKEKQLIFAPHAIDNKRFAGPDLTYATAAVEWRAKLGIKKDDLAIIFAAKIEPIKNPFILLEIAKNVKDENLKIIIVGNGILEKDLKSAASSDKRIVFIDFQNQRQMPVIYRLGDIFILPSLSETWGLAVNEAMACGLPVMISKNVGCGSDLVKNNENGLIFDSKALNILVSFINNLLREQSLAKKMGQNSKKIINGFSFTHIVEAIENSIFI
jgi:glycosyltransferase involved in cell wall biosynthesis